MGLRPRARFACASSSAISYVGILWFLSPVGLKTGLDFAHYCLKSGMVFKGTTMAYEELPPEILLGVSQPPPPPPTPPPTPAPPTHTRASNLLMALSGFLQAKKMFHATLSAWKFQTQLKGWSCYMDCTVQGDLLGPLLNVRLLRRDEMWLLPLIF